MSTKKEVKERKAAVVAERLKEMQSNVDLLVGMLDEKTLDALILALGLGHVEIDD